MHRKPIESPWRRLVVDAYRVSTVTLVDSVVLIRRNWEYALIVVCSTIAAGLLSAAIYGIAQQVN